MFKSNKVCIILSLVSIVLVLTMLGLWICQVLEFSVVSLDSFVGVMVAIMGLLVTFAVGWQILNALEIKSKLTKIEELKNDIHIQEERIEEVANTAEYDLTLMLAHDYIKQEDYLGAIMPAIRAIHLCLVLKTPRDIHIPLRYAKKSLNTLVLYQKTIPLDISKFIVKFNQNIQKESKYIYIKGQYEEMILPLIDKLKIENK